jgi:hypothetical protein
LLDYLVQNLDRMELTYFQARLQNKIRDEVARDVEVTDQILAELLCSEAYTLFPSQRLAVNQIAYTGRPYQWPRDGAGDVCVFVGWHWVKNSERAIGSESCSCTLAQGVEVQVWLENDPAREKERPLVDGRVKLLLEQQFQLARLSTEAIKSKAGQMEKARQLEVRLRQMHLQARTRSEKESLLVSVNTEWPPSEAAKLPYGSKDLPLREFLYPFLKPGEQWTDNTAGPRIRREVILALGGGLNAVVSGFVERPPIKAMTHANTGSPDLDCLDALWACVERVLDHPLLGPANEYGRSVRNIYSTARAKRDAGEPTLPHDTTKGIIRRADLLWPEIETILPGFEPTAPDGVAPECDARACIPFTGVIVPKEPFVSFASGLKERCSRMDWSGPHVWLFRLPWEDLDQFDEPIGEVLWRNYLAIGWRCPKGKWPDDPVKMATGAGQQDASVWIAGEKTGDDPWTWRDLVTSNTVGWDAIWPERFETKMCSFENGRQAIIEATKKLKESLLSLPRDKKLGSQPCWRRLLVMWDGWDTFSATGGR